jgi:hypothetical protein
VELLIKLEKGVSMKESEVLGESTSAIYTILRNRRNSCLNAVLTVMYLNYGQLKNYTNQRLVMWIKCCLIGLDNIKVKSFCSVVTGQAKISHEQLGLSALCEYYSGWFKRFKQQ